MQKDIKNFYKKIENNDGYAAMCKECTKSSVNALRLSKTT